MNTKTLFSYVYPQTIRKVDSMYSGTLQINLVNGRKVLDTSKCNYSYGSLQRILKYGLSEIKNFEKIQSILILGLGAGSVIQTIREELNSDAKIDAIEIDPEVIQIAKNDFQIERFANIHILEADAIRFVTSCSQKYDLIIVDLFILNKVPEAATGKEFIGQSTKLLNPEGKILYNTMRETMNKNLFRSIRSEFSLAGLVVHVIEQVEWTNNLILASTF